MPRKTVPIEKDVSNRHVILLALLLQGGASQFVDIEDIAVQAYRLAPTRFRWNRYDYPSVEAARVAFKHWKDLKNEEARFTSHRLSYSLTAVGVAGAVDTARILLKRNFANADEVITFYRAMADGGDPSEVQKAVSNGTRTTARPSQHELRRLRAHSVFKRWRSGETDFEVWEVADVLNCLPDSSARIWEERFNRFEAMASFWQDDELTRFLAALRKGITVK